MTSNGNKNVSDRVAIVSGLRTPFLKQGSGFKSMTTLELSTAVVNELIYRTGVDVSNYTLCVFGQVMPSLDYINLAREVVTRTQLDNATTVAHSVSQACMTSVQSLTTAINAIANNEHDAAIAGGADSMDDLPLGVSRKLTKALMGLQKAKTAMDRVRLLSGIAPKDLIPPTPGYSVEPSTGLSMGQHAELMVKDWGVSREWQDEIAHRSHTNAAKAWAEGFYDDLVMPVAAPPYKEAFRQDNIVRKDSNLAEYSKLRPVYDKKHGTITAANASPLTDGASAVVVMRESKAKSLGLQPMGYVRSWAYTAVDPTWQLLIGPALGVPKALERAGLTMKDIDLVEMHEAFAAQVACTLEALRSKKFCEEKLGLGEPIGEIDPSIFNVNGGSVALGHPFGATGGRMVMQGLKELKRRQKQFALMTICAGGAMGVAAVLEVA
ncbi:MAG: acetyl-CoA C-acyltransferase FadI [Polyangiaceae bacterium]|nr:acetyl-CoA C-acyltransferase FadI [Polyangiaceae bacterium]